MYRNKKDVDKHVEGLTSKLSLKEFKSRAYSVARLYFEVGDYASCQRYVEQYLSQKDNNAAAHKLLAQALYKLGQKEKALEQYKTSLDIDPTQTTLILDICELLADDEVFIDPGRAKYWCEKAEATFPRHPVTFRIREKLMASENPDPEALASLLTAELAVRPKDPTLHARLLRHYLQTNKIKEAFEHSCNVEFGGNPFLNNCAWYEMLAEILKHNSLDKHDWLYQVLNLTVRERLCVLGLTETPNGTSKSLVQSSELLHQYDQAIEMISKAGAPSGYAEFHAGLLQHHRGQFAFHAATFILKKAKKDQLSWHDASRTAAPFMLIAWHTIPLDTKVGWLAHGTEKLKIVVHRWYLEGSYRCSQAGHYLLSNVLDKTQSSLDLISQTCSGKHWRDKLYEKIFTGRDHLAKTKSSHLLTDAFNCPTLRLPRKVEVEAYDVDAQRQYPNSLHHFVWILINYKNYSHFQCTLFDMLAPKSRNYMNSGPETLNKLDIFAFLYSATLTAQQQKSNHTYDSFQKPKVLPANITDLLCPLPQMKWWDCAYKFSQNQLGTELTDIRATLSRGIEVIRCVDNHGLDPEMLCLLGRIFSERAKSTTAVEEKTNLESRAGLYYNSAIPLLEKLKSKIVIKVPEKRMFDYTHKELSNKDLNSYIEESKIYVAVNHLNDSEYEKVLDLLSNLKSPQAYFHLSQTYKRMALEEQNLSKDNDSKSKLATLLSKARNFAYKTLDRLKEIQEDSKHPLYSETQEIIEEIESNINKLDPDLSGTILNEIDGKYSSDENMSSAGSEHVAIHTNSHFRNLSSTPKHPSSAPNVTNYRTAMDSQVFETTRSDQKYLERIEKEIKNLQKRDTTISSFMEQTKNWFEENRNLSNQVISTINSNIQNTTDQFKLLKVSVDQVKDQIDECRNECKDVGELKKQLSDLKKEVNKLKKASSEQNIDDNDLYNLDEEYRTNESSSSFAAQLPFTPSQVMPPFNQRLLPPFPAVPNPYQFYGQSLFNLYNQYSQFSQAPQVPGAPPLFDSARSQVGYPGVYQTPEQMYPDVAHLIPPTVPPVPTMPPVPPVPVTVPQAAPAPVILPASVPKSTGSKQSKETPRSLPVNVVITSSDPLPTCTTAPQPILSVTIPPKHLKGIPHNYQIQMPAATETQVMTPSNFSTGALGNTSNSSITSKPFMGWGEAIAFKSAQATGSTPKANISANNSGFSLFDSPKTTLFDNSITVVDGNMLSGATPNTSLNKSRTISERSNTSIENYDPCPDFKPIVPLPAEVKVTTGEEDETAIFSSRAKLFRFVDKQWKERGIGEMKLLKHKVTGKVRVLMRREQVHKICANHMITPDMEIKPMKNESKAYFWSANDYADNAVVFEKFSVRFKTENIAKQFYETFEKARQEAKSSAQKSNSSDGVPIGAQTIKDLLNTPKREPTKNIESLTNKTVVGGFTFSSTPTFKSVQEDKPETLSEETATSKANPFIAISFKSNTSSPFSNLFSVTTNQLSGIMTSSTIPTQKDVSSSKFNTSDTVEEFEPTVEFKPVVPLPALVDHKTGEEDETVLFEHRAKLLRFESSNKEWKERGLGNIKLLAQKDNSQKVRLLMRREQVMKVCCNHALTRELVFEKMPNMDKAVTWCAKDFSEGELVAETFCLRFKTVQACDDFIVAVKSAQSKLTDESKAAKEEQNAAKQTNQVGFGDKFKPKAGSWSCTSCYTNNLESFLQCACCEQPKPQGQKLESAAAVPAQATPLNWGEKFKPKPGTWECKECFIRNEGSVAYCGACNSPKDPSIAKKENKSVVDNAPKFSFGIPSQTAATLQVSTTTALPITNAAPVTGWGDKFKPKEGSWECKQCFVRNEGNLEQCSACTSPKDPNAPKKETKSILDSASSGPKFSFGIPTAVNKENKPSTPSSMFDGTGSNKFSFGVPKEQTPAVTFGNIGATSVIFATPKKPDNETTSPLDLILKKNENLSVTVTPVKPALLPTPKKDAAFGSKEGGSFDFVFKPKTPSKGKSPIKSPKSEKWDESDENEYASEDEGHHLHFSPVVPLPDKIEVVTGEENEDELYGHRAKLFRFIAGEWKERGIGVVKILKHRVTGKLRVVMRREQVLKICLNHALNSEIVYTLKDDKTWLFVANDYSEGALSLQKFCLRFKTMEIASEFKEAIDKARDVNVSVDKDSASDDVVFIKEIQATEEEKEKAKELMLPENFFTYKSKEPCRGCRGCDEDDETKSANISTSAVDTTPVKQPSSTSIPTFFSPGQSLYGTPANFNRTQDNSVFRTPLESIGSNNNTSSPFSINNKNSDKENTFTPKADAFGELADKNSLFATSQGSLASDSNETLTTTPTKSGSLLAAPKLSAINTSKESDTKTPEPKSLFGLQAMNSVFGNSGASENTPLFGNSGKKSIFGSVTESKSLFASTPSTESKSLFSTGSKSIFSNVAQTENKSIFATTAKKDNKPMFGGAPVFVKKDDNKEEKPEVKSLFGSETDQKPVNLFQSPVQGSIFGPNAASNKPATGLFGSTGGSIFGNNTFGAGKSIFGSDQNSELKNDENPSLLGNSDLLKNGKETEKKETPFSVDNSLSFAALSTSGPGFSTQKKDDFKWEGAGSQLFIAGQKQNDKSKSKDDSAAGEEADAEGGGGEEYDPHYEPIVPLPDKIVVTTGEEDEEKTFGERAKLYRYDDKTKEWKERGVGEIKILFHPQRKTYRLLLRREQVHKAVLNMLVHMDLELLPMKNSDRAWTWAGVNYAESDAGQHEMLALRFKSVDLAQAFRDKVTDAVRQLQAAAAQAIREKSEAPKPAEAVAPLRLPKHLEETKPAEAVAPLRLPKHLEESARADPLTPPADAAPNGGGFMFPSAPRDQQPHVHFHEDEDQADDEEDYEDYDYYNEEEDAGMYYEGSALVTQGSEQRACPEAHVQVMLDRDTYSPKIMVTDAATGEILADMLIHTDTDFQMEGDSCTWTGTDYATNEPLDKTVTISFRDSENAMHFYDSCETSKAATYSSADPES